MFVLCSCMRVCMPVFMSTQGPMQSCQRGLPWQVQCTHSIAPGVGARITIIEVARQANRQYVEDGIADDR